MEKIVENETKMVDIEAKKSELDKLETLYYYFRDSKKAPRITVCLLYNRETGKPIARGTTFCSVKETPYKKKGREDACARAIVAWIYERNADPIQQVSITGGKFPKIFQVLEACSATINGYFASPDKDYKSVFNPILTSFESKLIERQTEKETKK
jgi:hypothetical protein